MIHLMNYQRDSFSRDDDIYGKIFISTGLHKGVFFMMESHITNILDKQVGYVRKFITKYLLTYSLHGAGYYLKSR